MLWCCRSIRVFGLAVKREKVVRIIIAAVACLMPTLASAQQPQRVLPPSERVISHSYAALGAAIDQVYADRDAQLAGLLKKLADTIDYAKACGNAPGCWDAVEEKPK